MWAGVFTPKTCVFVFSVSEHMRRCSTLLLNVSRVWTAPNSTQYATFFPPAMQPLSVEFIGWTVQEICKGHTDRKTDSSLYIKRCLHLQLPCFSWSLCIFEQSMHYLTAKNYSHLTGALLLHVSREDILYICLSCITVYQNKTFNSASYSYISPSCCSLLLGL